MFVMYTVGFDTHKNQGNKKRSRPFWETSAFNDTLKLKKRFSKKITKEQR